MTRNLVKTLLLVSILSGPGAIAASCAEPATRLNRSPNIVLFLVDDMGWIDPACYGNPFHETPNIDRLARQGMRFTDAYAACPVCSPTRASIMTGRYPATVNLTDFIPGHWRPWEKLAVPKFNQELPYSEVTIAEALKPAGYVSAAFGKWHLGGATHNPDSQGFDEMLVTGGRHFFPNFRTTPPEEIEDGAYLADVLTDHAEKFIEKHRDEPFLLYLPHYAVHIPLEAKQELITKYEQKQPKPPGRVNNPVYAAMVEHIDQSLGRIMAKLDELQLADDTLLVFFSDNGGLYQRFDKQGGPVMVNMPLRDEKGSLHEGGIREPLIVRWPGHVPAGAECHVPVSSVDLLPTFVELAGPETKSALTNRLDGVSLVPLLTQRGELSARSLFWHYPHYHHTTPAGAIRKGDLKLIEYFDDGHVELYDLKRDLSEKHNLAAERPEVAKALQQELAAWRDRVGANMPTPNRDYDPEKASQWKQRPRQQRAPQKRRAVGAAKS
ncbi:sulfatase-like hydrolase/transferase [bacterium]|nr:sulfatase-like hydrolase/transferase [bacterium]